METHVQTREVALDDFDERLARDAIGGLEELGIELGGGGEESGEAGLIAGAAGGRHVLELGIESPIAERRGHGGSALERSLPVVRGERSEVRRRRRGSCRRRARVFDRRAK